MMKIFNRIAELRHNLDLERKKGHSIGLVPTMGALHHGHAQLIKSSVESCDLTVCSIFVNPTQFNNSEDLINYPKRQEADERLLAEEGCDVIFAPSVEEMYPNGQQVLNMGFGFLETVLEGEFRPGHFSGVGVVVAKLLNMVQPDKAFFGQKDLQQLAVIKKLVHDLNIPSEIVSVQTIREPSGLAMSSRNLRLSEVEKKIATNLYKTMQKLKAEVLDGIAIVQALNHAKADLTDLDSFSLEYLEVVNSDTMQHVDDIKMAENVSICAAAHVGEVRIIDNIYLKQHG
ncbi:MAG: pantoate--beta-alanine ligase [Reichenbachiella sp.]|uniref:pantoate--beta-alanine ligase n=1 Tax=Reichenbachiella sp. TaxID=2184521 RepID=UPI0032675550